MISVFEFIDRKRCGKAHSAEEIKEFVKGVTSGEIPDYQTSAWLMAVCLNGMNADELAALTDAMENSGEVLSPRLGGICVDKHSTGGVGDKVTLFAAPVCASCGVYVPKMSGSGLGITGGTIDKLSAIPGLDTDLEYNEFLGIVEKAGFAVAGHNRELVPADKKLYELRNATATVESIPLIASSIMSKKLATGADAILLDVKTGSGAFMKTEENALELAETMLGIAKAAGRKAAAVITDMNKPLGKTAGNAVEVMEAFDALKGRADENFRETAYAVAREMLVLAGKGSPEECEKAVNEAVTSGRALDSFRRMIELQGGDPRVCDDYSLFPQPRFKKEIISRGDGYIGGISCDKTGLAALRLGAGRKNKESAVDVTAGIRFFKAAGEPVKKGELLAELYSSDKDMLEFGAEGFEDAFEFSENRIRKVKNVIKILRND